MLFFFKLRFDALVSNYPYILISFFFFAFECNAKSFAIVFFFFSFSAVFLEGLAEAFASAL